MSTSIIGIPTTRVSDLFVRQRLLNQVQFDQRDLFRLQMQLATGRRFEVPSEDPVSALRVMSLQRLLERKSQVASNLTTNQSYLSNTDVTLAGISNNMADVRATALGVLGTLATDEQRRAAAQQVHQSLQSLMETGNQMFRGRYLFAGSLTSVRPFTALMDGAIRYDGNEGRVQSYADLDLLFSTNLHGTEVFGGLSEPVRGSVDLNPRLTHDTRVVDLRAGRGISKGAIRISDGSNVSTIDLSSASTIGEIAALIKANPPPGRELHVEVTSDTLRIRLAGTEGNLSIHEVAGGTVAYELGILHDIGVGLNPISGRDLDPILRTTTSLDDLLGVRAWAVLHSPGADNDVRLVANQPGIDGNNLQISLLHDPTVVLGNETVDYDPVAGTLVVRIQEGSSTAANVVAAINARGDVPYTATVDRLDDVDGGRGRVMAGISAVTAEGRGVAFDRDHGLRVENQNEVFDVAFSTAQTVEDLLNTLNGLGAGVLAEINASRTGINLRSRVSGSDFMIGENGGATAAQLGLRTFTRETLLSDLNYGQGIHPTDGVDFTITIAGSPLAADGSPIPFEVDVSGLTTIGQVIDRINSLAPGELEARLTEFGNGIALVDTSSGPNTLKVERTFVSAAAIELGLIPRGGEVSAPPAVKGTPEGTIVSPGFKSDVIIRATAEGSQYNGVVVILDDGIPPGPAVFDPDAKTLTFGINGGLSAAGLLANLVAGAGEHFTGELDPADGSGNDGTGNVDATDLLAPPEATGGSLTSHASALVSSAGFDNDLIFTANPLGVLYNGTKIHFVDAPGSGPPAVVSYTVGVELTIEFDSTASHTAADIAAAVAAHAGASAHWTVTLDPADESPNDGSGAVAANAGVLMEGGEQALDGRDVRPLEAESLFTALIRLRQALEVNDVNGVQRAIEMLDRKVVDLNFSRAELGARQQSIDLLQYRIDTEEIELRSVLSLEYDADMVEVISNLAARQAAFEASLRSMGTTMRMSLLDYL